MADYQNEFPPAVAVDENGTQIRSAEAVIYARTDTTFSAPLPITDLQGVPMTRLRANDRGIYPAFVVPSGEVQITAKSGDALTPMTSIAGQVAAVEIFAEEMRRVKSEIETTAGRVDQFADAAGQSAQDAVLAAERAEAAGAGESGPVLPIPNEVDAVGESTTANAGYETHLASYTGLSITNKGRSGEGIADELMRVGAIRPRIAIEGNVIPSGPFDVLVTAIDPAEGWRRNGTGSFAFGVVVKGLSATLSNVLTSNTFRLSGTNPDEPLDVPAGTQIARNPANLTPTRRIMFESLRNNVGPSLLRIREMLALIYNAQSTQIKDVLFVGLINGSSEGRSTANYDRIVAANELSAEQFGSRFFDIRRPFIDRGLEIRGIKPTVGDRADIAADRPPRSLWETGGGIHPNADGYLVKNYLIAEKMLEIGWVNALSLPAIPEPDPEPEEVVWETWTSDSFDRADGAYGATDAAAGGTSRTPDAIDAQIGVIDKQFGTTTRTTAERYVYFDTGGEVSIEVDYLGGGRMQLRLRRSGTTYYQFEAAPTSGSGIYRVVNGTKSPVATASIQPVIGSRIRFEAAVVDDALRLRAFSDGTLIAEFVDSTPLTGTQVAFGSPNSSSAWRVDNLLIQKRAVA